MTNSDMVDESGLERVSADTGAGDRPGDIADESGLRSEARISPDNGAGQRSGSATTRRGVPGTIVRVLQDNPLFVVLIAVILLFSLLRPNSFPTYNNVTTVVQNQAVLIIIAFAAMIPLAAGEFDLSVANNMGLSSLLMAGLTTNSKVSPVLAVLIVFGISMLIGAINGIVVSIFTVPAFVATLAMATVLDGFSLAYSGGAAIVGIPQSVLNMGRTEIFGSVPVAMIYLVAAALILWWLTARTPFGRYLFAIGGNREAVRRMGIPVNTMRVMSFVAAGGTAGLGGVLYAAQVGAATPGVGASFLLPAYAAVFLGAAAFRSRQFSIPGTLVAAVLLAATVTGLLMLGVPSWADEVFNGVILIIAVIWSNFMSRQRNATL